MGKYRDIIKWGEQQCGIRMLTHEYEVISLLFDADQMTPMEMMKYFCGSSTNFFRVLKSLEDKHILCSVKNTSDRRSKYYRLSEKTISVFSDQWLKFRNGVTDILQDPGDPVLVLRNYTRNVGEQLKIRQFTCEYQIMMYLYASPGITNIRFHDLINVSQAKFNNALMALKNSEKIYCVEDPSDGRMKLYHLADQQKKLFDELNDRLALWMASNLDFLESRLGQARQHPSDRSDSSELHSS